MQPSNSGMRTEVLAESLATEALTWIVAIIVLAALLPTAASCLKLVNQIQQGLGGQATACMSS